MNNNIIDTAINHKSIRNYQPNREIPQDIINNIVKAMNCAPTSINGQGLTILNIKDKSLRAKVAELSWGQQQIIDCSTFLVFVMDFNKANIACQIQNQEMKITQSVESVVVGSVDIGIALGTGIAIAENMGFGTCCIGAVRNSPEEMSKVLNLPNNCFALVGLCIGYTAQDDKTEVKPKIPLDGYCLDNLYNQEIVESSIKKYDELMADYFDKRGEKNIKWSTRIAGFYSKVYYPGVYPELLNKNFKLNS